MLSATGGRINAPLTGWWVAGAPGGAPPHRLGYRSEAAFARAFKRVIGVPPGAVKRSREPSVAGYELGNGGDLLG
jgi:hypothetical protein